MEFLEVYLERCRKKEISAGEVLLQPKKENRNIYVLLRGLLTVHLDSLDNPPLLSLKPGECAGEMSIIDHKEPSAYVVAATDSLLFVIGQDALWPMLYASDGLACNLLMVLSGRLRQGDSIIVNTTKTWRLAEQEATVDPLTGLHNRRWMEKMFKRELQRCAKDNQPAYLIMLDLDNFKSLNDQFGHLTGDQALRIIANILKNKLRPSDMTVRFGGEEFVILLPRTEWAEAFAIAERLRQTIAEATIQDQGKRDIQMVTASLGVAPMQKGDSLKTLLSAADGAMYRAKGQGRNCVSK